MNVNFHFNSSLQIFINSSVFVLSCLVVSDSFATLWININNLRYADDTSLMAESEEELKSLLMKVKEESEKVGLELNIE